MSKSRDDFIKHLNAYREALALEDVVNSGQVGRSSSKLLRNGLAVVAFNALEDFFKSRVGEVLSDIGGSGVGFSELPEGVRKSSTFGVLNSIGMMAKHAAYDDDSKIRFIQEETLKISSTKDDQSFQLTSYAYGYGNSNVGSGEIKRALKDFQVNDPWRVMSLISSKLGMSSLPLKDAYDNAAERRHKAAHVADANTLYPELQSFLFDSVSIALSMDVLISECYRRISEKDHKYICGVKVDHSFVDAVMVKNNKSKWKVYLASDMSRAKRAFSNKKDTVAKGRDLAVKKRLPLLVFDESHELAEWCIYY
uniref:HEPN domain-containing protein n=1 Tax=uncultured Halomonas sp. TaxID=173971 RepID=UPI0026155F35|nr:HEPN domain-containing protein [uncultured Halomonas sp.]